MISRDGCLLRWGSLLGLVWALAGPGGRAAAWSAEVSTVHPVVPGFERFHDTARAGNGDGNGANDALSRIEGGLILLGELNCTSCHAADASAVAVIARKQAPILDQVGRRVRPEYLRAFLSDPHAVKAGTTMPHVLAGMSAVERAETVEALVHFLSSMGGGTGSPAESLPDRRKSSAGKKLYHQVGCVACHGRRDQAGPRLSASMPLGDLAAKYTIPSLITFLQDPLRVRPSGRMPALSMNPNEVTNLAHYLLQDLQPVSRPTSSTGPIMEAGPSFPTSTRSRLAARGRTTGFDLDRAGVANHWALRFEGTLQLPSEGHFTFHLTSDDGSKLWIDDALVVNNDGVHPEQTHDGSTVLAKGRHRLVAGVFDGGGESMLDVEIEGPGLVRQPVASFLVPVEDGGDGAEARADKPAPGPFRIDRTLVDKGLAHFTRLGCASCHQLRQGGAAIASTLAAPPISALRGDARGCLAVSHEKSGLLYRLSEPQRAALTDALQALNAGKLGPPTPREVVARTMTAFNCYACHQRDGKGGVEETRQEFFQTTQKEMGDEGRIPPSLDGVGASSKPTT